MAASNSPAAKTERLMNLVMTLLYTRRPMPKARIREVVEAYRLAPNDEAFDRMFERDKEELRELGVPLVTEDVTAAWEDEPGYRIHQRDYALPQIDFAPDELAVLGLAARAWSHATLAGPAAEGLRKLRASGVEPDGEAFIGIEPRLATTEPAFAPLLDALTQRQPVAFGYRRSGAGEIAERHVQPWGLTNWHGRWYLTGNDTDRGAPRVFRLSRVVDPVRADGKPADYRIPKDHDGPLMIRTSASPSPSAVAEFLVREGSGHLLRRSAGIAPGRHAPSGWSRLVLPYADLLATAADLASFGGSVRVLGPAQLADAVRSTLASAAAAHGGGAPA